MKDLIPHQLGLSRPQGLKMMKGLPITISHAKMGSGAGEEVLMLGPTNARKLMTAYKKGKGVRIQMMPHEISATQTHGRGFFSKAKSALKSVAKAVAPVAKTVSRVVAKALKSPEIKALAKQGVDLGAQSVGEAVGKATGNKEIASQLASTLQHSAHAGIDSGSVKAGLDTAKADIKEHAKGHLNDAIEQHVPDKYQKLAKSVAHEAISHLDDHPAIISHEEVHPPSVDEHSGIDEDAIGLHSLGIGGSGLYGSKARGLGSVDMKEKMAKLRAMRKGGKINLGKAFKSVSNVVKKVASNPLVKSIAKQALPYAVEALGATVGGVMGGPGGAIAGEEAGRVLGNYGASQIGSGLGIRRRGRPRKGAGVKMSGAYKSALRDNFSGLSIPVSSANAPRGSYPLDARVKPSSVEMTLSPYQSTSSPAMNPFVPTTYAQQGGQECGYGRVVKGRGLY
jgi:hypothetical protein